MTFATSAWRALVAVKDGLTLLVLLSFFLIIYVALASRFASFRSHEGALLLRLDGSIVEQASSFDPVQALLSGTVPPAQYQARDLVRALDLAARDQRITAVVMDLDRFLGGGQVNLIEVGAALGRVRATGKPVLVWSTGYSDDGMLLAAHANEVWTSPMGGALITGPGASSLYFGGLLKRIGVRTRIYKVGIYKSAVEPYDRNSMSAPARENYQTLHDALWGQWRASVGMARPAMQIERVTKTPARWIAASNGDLASASLSAGLVDRLGSFEDFEHRVAALVGIDESNPGSTFFRTVTLEDWLASNPVIEAGASIGVITIDGELVDGEGNRGDAGGGRIARILDEALDLGLKGLVVRVNSPGGSIVASETVRLAVMRHKERGIPVTVSMSNVAASGGYWLGASADRIFAQPATVTGSIGVFAVFPEVTDALLKLGISSDRTATTPLSGQPDALGGVTPEMDYIQQASVEDAYADFLSLVSSSRKLTISQVEAIAQGRVWDGYSAHRLGLVDQIGGVDEAIEWTASKARVRRGGWHVRYLGSEQSAFATIVQNAVKDRYRRPDYRVPYDMLGLLSMRRENLRRHLTDGVGRLSASRGVQAYCLECPTE